MTIKVMLIDDHPVVRAGLRAILDSFDDIEVVAEGSSGKDVERLFAPESLAVDVVVCDIQMPGMDGISATRRVRDAGGPPVLILTTYDTEADIIAAVEAWELDYLLKDSPEQVLHDAVVATVEGRRTLSPAVAGLLSELVGRPQQSLSAREIEILQALAACASNKQLAKQMFISAGTVKTHVNHIYQKLGVDNRTAAVTVARERKLILRW